MLVAVLQLAGLAAISLERENDMAENESSMLPAGLGGLLGGIGAGALGAKMLPKMAPILAQSPGIAKIWHKLSSSQQRALAATIPGMYGGIAGGAIGGAEGSDTSPAMSSIGGMTGGMYGAALGGAGATALAGKLKNPKSALLAALLGIGGGGGAGAALGSGAYQTLGDAM